MTDTVLRRDQDGVALLTLNRPDKKNAFNTAQWKGLAGALDEIRADDALKCVVLTGAGSDFSAGQDLGEMAAPPPDAAQAFPSFMESLVAFDKPLLAAVRGVGVGGGATIPLHCDVVYLGRSARFRYPFSALGLVPEAASSLLLPQLIGPQRAAEIFFTSEWIHAPRALELGLAARVLPDDEVLDALMERAREIACFGVGSLRAIKRLLLEPRRQAVHDTLKREMAAMSERVGTPENLEALKNFFSKGR